jgi:hypothetical protein
MPKQKDLKRRVRTRMQKTGESYTAARSKIMGTPDAPVEDYARLAGMSDKAVKAKTGCEWATWVKALDYKKASKLSHKEIAKLVQDTWDVGAWWAQTVTVGYERIRGLRDTGQRRGGGYDVNKSKTLPVSIGELYAAFGARKRRRWVTDLTLTVRKANVDKSIRFVTENGHAVNVHFWAKGPHKSQVQLQHLGLASKREAERVRAEWTERLAALGELLA